MPTLGLLVTRLIGFLSLSPSLLYLGIYRSSYYSLIRLLNSYSLVSFYLSFAPTFIYLGVSNFLGLGPNLAH